LTTLVFGTLSAQTTSTKKTTTATAANTTATTNKSTDKVNKTLDDTNKGIDNATYTTEKAKKTFEDLSKIFKPKTANETLVIIPDIEFEDANLMLLKDAIEDQKGVKKASADYSDGTATITVVLKGKDKVDFWFELPKEVKEIFKMKTKKDNSILVIYKKSGPENLPSS
jgi:hypothetical protein